MSQGAKVKYILELCKIYIKNVAKFEFFTNKMQFTSFNFVPYIPLPPYG